MSIPIWIIEIATMFFVVLGWIFSCNEQFAVSVTCWGDQTSFISRANKPHRLHCQKHYPLNRDESETGQLAYGHTASTVLQSPANRLGGGLIKPIYLQLLFVLSLFVEGSFTTSFPFLIKDIHVYCSLKQSCKYEQ